jgi:hypothetical protein
LQLAIPVVHHPEDFMTPMGKVVYGTLGDRKGEQSSRKQSESRRWAKS